MHICTFVYSYTYLTIALKQVDCTIQLPYEGICSIAVVCVKKLVQAHEKLNKFCSSGADNMLCDGTTSTSIFISGCVPVVFSPPFVPRINSMLF